MTRVPKKVLIIRNDKLGDFALALPAFHALKATLPNTELHALVPVYTAPIAKACCAIDDILIDPGPKASIQNQLDLLTHIKQQHYDASITLFSTGRIAVLLTLANIDYRLAPATKWAQLLYTDTLKQKRSQSTKPEYQYNLDLIEHFIKQCKSSPNSYPLNPQSPPFLTQDTAGRTQFLQHFRHTHAIAPDSPLIFIHPGSGGSSNNLTIDQYAQLADLLSNLSQQANIPTPTIVITAGPNELEIAQSLQQQLSANTKNALLYNTQGLDQFLIVLQTADLFIGGSTGPLHIAAALNRPNVGFYPNASTASALRWQTVSDTEKRLSFTPDQMGDKASAMASMDMVPIATSIHQHFLNPDCVPATTSPHI